MKRREFITRLGGGVAGWPFAARAQRAMPVVGWLSGISEQAASLHHAQFLRGLEE
jgi:putative tryptophan/tyrosine transport system substrate-binding protein